MIDNSSFEVDMTVSVELWPHDEGDLAVTVSVGGEHHHTMPVTFEDLVDDVLSQIDKGERDHTPEEAEDWKDRIAASLRRGLEKLGR
jgi:hypothetical protein